MDEWRDRRTPEQQFAADVKQYKKLLRINPDRSDMNLCALLACDPVELDKIREAAERDA